MKILTVDVGTGTQDIFLYNSKLDIENGFKMVLPSPTMMVRKRVQQAANERRAVALTGWTMGGGPNAWAVEDHLRAGLPVFATPGAAKTFNDDLDTVERMGIHILEEGEIEKLPDEVLRIELRDFDFQLIHQTLDSYGVSLHDLAAVAVAVFDHGAAPVDISDRKFRFDYLNQRIQAENRLSAFAYRSENIPPEMTRLQAVANSVRGLDIPLVVMDTAPAAVLGAAFDPAVMTREQVIITNVGNFHSLAFRLGPGGIEGVFEHHTGLLNQTGLEDLIQRLADGSLTNADVFDAMGHGALVYSESPMLLNQQETGVVVTGPRRNLLNGSLLKPYFAVPFGDMMIAGCFGLLSATADLLPELKEPIHASLHGKGGSGTPPWETGL
jgi:uncharacterized protein (DUF1786 family)